MGIDKLTREGIYAFLKDELKNKTVIDIKECVGSTNAEVKALAASGVREGYVLISRSQTNGKGRLGRSFYSPNGTGVYMSVLLRPSCSPTDATLITTAAAVCVCRALEKIGVYNAQIKWVNDIYLNKRKVCGILTESGFKAGDSTLDYAVLGVGINMYAPEGGFPAELQGVAGVVFNNEQKNKSNQLAGEFLNEFFDCYNNLLKRNYIEEYRGKCFVLGQNINIITQLSSVEAKAVDVDENCNLIVEYPSGERGCVGTGEISVRVAE